MIDSDSVFAVASCQYNVEGAEVYTSTYNPHYSWVDFTINKEAYKGAFVHAYTAYKCPKSALSRIIYELLVEAIKP